MKKLLIILLCNLSFAVSGMETTDDAKEIESQQTIVDPSDKQLIDTCKRLNTPLKGVSFYKDGVLKTFDENQNKFVEDSPFLKTCVCGKKAGKQCGQCNAVGYCSKECQNKNWKYHKKDCLSLRDRYKKHSK